MVVQRFLLRFVLSIWFFVMIVACAPLSVPQTLQQRPLHLPTVAPGSPCSTTPEKKVTPSFGIAQGNSPAYATIGTTAIRSPAVLQYADAQHFGGGTSDNQGWGGQKVLWFVNPSYHEVVLIRGHQVDGPHEMRFETTLDQQLVLDTTLGVSPWPNFPSYTHLQVPGCYAYQVDGDNFSYVIVFQAAPLKIWFGRGG